MSEIQVIVFELNNEVYGTDTMLVQEIVAYQNLTKTPDMVEFLDGFISLRGKSVPVVDLNTRFGLGYTTITKKTKIVVTRIEENYIGFVVNNVKEIIKLSEGDIETDPGIIGKGERSYMRGIGKKDGVVMSVIDLRSILTTEEIAEMK